MTTKKSSSKAIKTKVDPEVVKKDVPYSKKDEPILPKKKEVAPPPPKEETPKELLVTFARWFTSKKFKPHWAAGMQAYADTSRRRTMSDWDRLFKAY